MPYVASRVKPCAACDATGSVRNPCHHPEDALDGPYLRCEACNGDGDVMFSRRAFGAVGEVVDYVDGLIRSPGVSYGRAVRSSPESGGSLVLPDGSRVTVEAATWADLREEVGFGRDGFTLDHVTLTAWNERHK